MARTPKTRSNKTVAFDGTPVFAGIARVLKEAREDGVRIKLNSADRRKGVAERYGKLSQAVLYARWIARWAGYNPANPPNRSTHELRSDGAAYRGPVGRPLAWWQLGLDLDGAKAFVTWAKRKGYDVRRPYPDGREAHHVNFYRNPRRTWLRRWRRKLRSRR